MLLFSLLLIFPSVCLALFHPPQVIDPDLTDDHPCSSSLLHLVTALELLQDQKRFALMVLHIWQILVPHSLHSLLTSVSARAESKRILQHPNTLARFDSSQNAMGKAREFFNIQARWRGLIRHGMLWVAHFRISGQANVRRSTV